MSELIVCGDELIESVLTCATNVHRELGPGLFESVYEAALKIELDSMNISYECQKEVSVFYKGNKLGIGFKADLIIDNSLILELKSVNAITDIHVSQIITYLKLLNIKRGFLINFNVKLLKDGIKRISI